MTAETPDVAPLDRFECRACGYIYEPSKGDENRSIPPGTAFADLPVNWRCPVCSAPKKQFSNIGPVGIPLRLQGKSELRLGCESPHPGQKNILIFGGLALAVLFLLSFYNVR